MSSNLPPGVTTSMLPGNRPEDHAAEAFSLWLWDLIEKHLGTSYDDVPEEKAEALEAEVQTAINRARSDGYAEGAADLEQARRYREEAHGQDQDD